MYYILEGISREGISCGFKAFKTRQEAEDDMRVEMELNPEFFFRITLENLFC